VKTESVIQFFGGVKETADRLGITREAIYQWGDEVPESRAYQIEVMSEGKLKARAPASSQRTPA